LCGARLPPKRRSTHSIIISRIISPEIPAVVASQAMTSPSWQSRTKAAGGGRHLLQAMGQADE